MIPGWLHCAWLIVQCQTRLFWAHCVLSAPCKVFAACSAFWWHRAPCRTASLWVRAPLQQVWLSWYFLPQLLAPERPWGAPAKDTKTQRGAELHISSACKENLWGLLPNPRRAAHPASEEPRCQQAGAHQHLLRELYLPNPSQHWGSLAALVSETSKVITKRREDSNSSAVYDDKNIFACPWAAFIPSVFLHSGSVHNLYQLQLVQQLPGSVFPKFSHSQHKAALLEYQTYSILFGIMHHGQTEDHTQNEKLHCKGITRPPDWEPVPLQVTAMGKFSGLFGMWQTLWEAQRTSVAL